MYTDLASFPSLGRAITDFIYQEEGDIGRGKMLAIGTLMVVAAMALVAEDVYAGHGSHSSHGSHASHASHGSHASHASSSHSSHYNVAPPAPTAVPPRPTPAAKLIVMPTATVAPTSASAPTPVPPILLPKMPPDTNTVID
jgi:hypothetical protein